MRKRTRSPNYPSISLPDALERLARLRNEIQWHKAPREVVAKGIGYAKLHGASAGAISALQKYGLLERDGDDLKISDLGKRYLNPLGSEEESEALVEAATNPSLFAELDEQFPGGTSNDDLLQNYLVRKGFSQVALPSVLRAYRETLELVAQRAGNYNQDPKGTDSERQSEPSSTVHPGGDQMVPDTTAPSVSVADSGKFLVSMTDEFYVDVSASRLDRDGVQRLVTWLQANQVLVPEPKQSDKGTSEADPQITSEN